MIAEQTLFREALSAALARRFLIVGSTSIYQLDFISIKQRSPRIVILDIALMIPQIVTIIKKVRKTSPNTKILTLVPDWEFPCISEIESHSSAVLLKKSAGLTDLFNKIYSLPANADETTTSASCIPSSQNTGTSMVASLTTRELQIIQLLMSGHTSKEIASRLKLSPKTIEVHRHRILDKVKQPNTASLINMIQSAGFSVPFAK